jgi:hypothetical protein
MACWGSPNARLLPPQQSLEPDACICWNSPVDEGMIAATRIADEPTDSPVRAGVVSLGIERESALGSS